MPRDDDQPQPSDLDSAKARLWVGLKRCRELVTDCRSKLILASRSNRDDQPMFTWRNRPDDDPPA